MENLQIDYGVDMQALCTLVVRVSVVNNVLDVVFPFHGVSIVVSLFGFSHVEPL